MKTLKIIIPFIIVSIVALYFLNRIPYTQILGDLDNNILVFGSPDCPHCQTVKDYINDNQISQKLPIMYLDLSSNQAYSRLLSEKASICNIDPSEIGVPFYFYQDQCLMGDEPIIETFKQMLK